VGAPLPSVEASHRLPSLAPSGATPKIVPRSVALEPASSLKTTLAGAGHWRRFLPNDGPEPGFAFAPGFVPIILFGVIHDVKIALAIFLVVLALFFAFAYFHSKSIDRARLINTASALLAAHEQWHQHGSITNVSAYTRIYGFTNQVTVEGAEYFAELAADVPGLTNAGRLIATTDGTLIWMDRQSGPIIIRGQDRRIVMPRRFHDF
jgi:hypothetical protein